MLKRGKTPNMNAIVEELHEVLVSPSTSSLKIFTDNQEVIAAQVSSLVDRRTSNPEEKGKCTAAQI